MYQHGIVGIFAFVLFAFSPITASADKVLEMAAVEADKPLVVENTIRRLSFDVQRNGKTIGQHVVDIRDDGEQVVVDTKIDVAIKLAFVTIFRYSHTGHEVWEGGKLQTLDSLSNDNGNEIKLVVKREDDALRVTGTRFDGLMGEFALPTSYWNTATIDCNKMFNTQNGKPMDVSVQEDGNDVINVGGNTVEATKYVIDGDLKKEIWYDRAGTWVKSVFNVRGQHIEYVLTNDEVKVASTDSRVVTQ